MIADLFANRALILGFVAALGIAAPPPAADEVLRIAPDGTRVAPDPGGGPAWALGRCRIGVAISLERPALQAAEDTVVRPGMISGRRQV